MKTHVTFLAEGLNQVEPKKNFINDSNFGEDMAQWIIDGFNKSGDVSADPEPLQEDWGWRVYVSTDGFSGNIGLGSYVVGTSSGDHDGWVCFWDKPKWKKPFLFFGRAKADEYNKRVEESSVKIILRFHGILCASQRISQIRWHDEADFLKGNEESWTPKPL
ncbi:hypothetical protein [Synechococcus sp. CCAP 1479/9]|uniref:hypothetical protein n=1 Tax=Synechococcus sp. CCAP 1479/9 TaxID=1221593 RepID=UPI001C232DA1|nr:hypothetical protein [Synechococcus sp. CCAP 1479/9]